MVLESFDIQRILNEINSSKDRERRSSELAASEVYDGKLHLYIVEKLKKIYPKTWEAYNVADYNIQKKVVDKKSKSYQKPPIRSLDNSDESKQYNKILDDFNFNDAMKLMDRYKNRHLYCGIGIIRERKDPSDVGKDVYNFWALAPYEFCVHRDQKGDIYAWSIPLGKDGDYDVWVIWSDKTHIKIRTKDYKSYEVVIIKGNENFVNPYGIIPFVYVPLDMAGCYPYPSSLTRQTIELNTNLSIYLTSGNMQIGQLVIRYPKNQPLDWVVQGIYTALKLPQETKSGSPKTEASYISPSPNLEGHKDSIITFMQMILDEHGINSSSVTKNGNEKFTSGFDRLIANADVQDIIEDNQDAYTRVENEVYKIIKQMNSRDGLYTFKSEKLKVRFARPKILASDSEKLDNLKKKKELGLWELHELIMEADPNLSEEDAKAKAALLAPKTAEPKEEDGNREEPSIQDS